MLEVPENVTLITAEVLSMLEEIRVCYLLHRLTSAEKAPSGYDILKMATRGSAKLLGREDIGSLEVGKCGDLFLVNSGRVTLTGACFDPKSMLATVGLHGVDYTVVAGRLCVSEGRLSNINEESIAHAADLSVKKYLNR